MGLLLAKGSGWLLGMLVEHASPGTAEGFDGPGFFHWHQECHFVNAPAFASAQG